MPLSDAALSRTRALTTQDVANLLKVSKQKVNEMVAAGELPAMRFGRAVRFDPQVLSDWLKQAASTPTFKPLAVVPVENGKKRRPFKSLLPGRPVMPS